VLAHFDSIRTLGVIGVFSRTEYGAACKIIYLAFGTLLHFGITMQLFASHIAHYENGLTAFGNRKAGDGSGGIRLCCHVGLLGAKLSSSGAATVRDVGEQPYWGCHQLRAVVGCECKKYT
jgi:hypothetical protein